MSTIKTSKPSLNGNLLRSGFAVAALMACAASAYAATPSTPTVGEKVDKAEKMVEKVMSDNWITTKVKSEILANSASKAFKVEVKTKDGVVTLNGKLASKDAVDLVKLIAEKVEGVKSVDASGLKVAG